MTKPKANPMGPPTKKNPERLEVIRSAIKAGLDYGTAAQCAGITRQTLSNWRRDDPDLFDELERLKGEAVKTVAMKLMDKIKEGDLKAIQFFLKSRAEEFRERSTVDVNVDDKRPVLVVEPRAGSADEWAAENRLATSEN